MFKAKPVDTIDVKEPCSESWEDMQGTASIRFCSHCAHSVDNLSEMTRKEAMRLVRRSEGRLCVRYIMDPETKQPLFSDTLHQIVRRAPRLAAGVVTATIALSSAGYAQTGGEAAPAAQILNETQPSATTSRISGYVTDQNGAALPFALVGLLNEQTSEYLVQNASGEGFYEFLDLPAGTYKVKAEAGGFSAAEISSITVSDGSEVRRDARLAVAGVDAAVEVDTNVEVQGTAIMGLMTATYQFHRVNKLVEAVYRGDVDEIKLLVAKGHRVNSKDKNNDGATPLHAAVQTGNMEIVQFLLSSGAKINGRDSSKRTPVMRMDGDATPELLQLLLRYGAKVDLVDNQRFTALGHFAVYDRPDVFRLLILAGANVNAANRDGLTPLMIAAQNENAEAVKILVESGADVNQREKDGESAWEMTGSMETKSLLESYGATVRDR